MPPEVFGAVRVHDERKITSAKTVRSVELHCIAPVLSGAHVLIAGFLTHKRVNLAVMRYAFGGGFVINCIVMTACIVVGSGNKTSTRSRLN